MTNLITRARKEWTHSHPDHEGQGWHYRAPCPPEVVAALLGVLTEAMSTHGRRRRDDECSDCIAVDDALAAISQALEGP